MPDVLTRVWVRVAALLNSVPWALMWRGLRPTAFRVLPMPSPQLTSVERDELAVTWESVLTSGDAERQAELQASIPTIYQMTVGRLGSIEAKAVGAVQVAAVVAVGTFVALAGDGEVPRLFASIGLVYLGLSVWASAACLLPRARRLATMRTLRNDQPPLVTMAVAAEAMDHESVKLPNLVTSALSDLVRAAIATAIALLVQYL